MTRHCMIDLETMGLRPGCAVLSIGAVVFDVDLGVRRSMSFKRNVDLQSSLELGLTVDPRTEEWWSQQSDEAKLALRDPQPINVIDALGAFSTWYYEHECTRVWSHGASTDVPWLAAVYHAAGAEPPWGYRDVRDTRTLYDLAEGFEDFFGPRSPLIEHCALEDAVAQAETVVNALQVLGA